MDITLDKSNLRLVLPREIERNGIGAKGDSNGRVINFKLPKNPSPVIDLSSAEIKIDWINPDGLPGTDNVINNDVDGDEVRFSWIIPPPFCAQYGNATFSIRANQNGSVWHSSEVSVSIARTSKPDKDYSQYVIVILATDEEVNQMLYEVFDN